MALTALVDDLVTANHILYNEGVVDGFGHVSIRHPGNPERYFLARSLAPAVVKRDDILEFDLDSNAIDAGGARPYLERFIQSNRLGLAFDDGFDGPLEPFYLLYRIGAGYLFAADWLEVPHELA